MAAVHYEGTLLFDSQTTSEQVYESLKSVDETCNPREMKL